MNDGASKVAPSGLAAPAALPEDYDFSTQIGHLLRRAHQRHVALFQQLIADTQLTAPQFVVLCTLHTQGACSMTDIVKATIIDQATVRGVIDRLKARELIEVQLDLEDRRKVLVSLTQEGCQLVEETVPFALTITENTYGTLNPAERVALTYLLRKMCEI